MELKLSERDTRKQLDTFLSYLMELKPSKVTDFSFGARLLIVPYGIETREKIKFSSLFPNF